MPFTQFIELDGADEQALRDHVGTWHTEQSGQAPGYLSARLFADDESGRHIIAVDFASPEQAGENNDREATRTWATALRDLGNGEPTYRNLRQVYAT